MKIKLSTLLLMLSCTVLSAQDTKKPSSSKPATTKPAPTTKPAAVKEAPAAKPSPPKPEQAKKASEEDIQRAWQESMTPGPFHEMLARYTGDWKEIVTMWNAPGAEPVTMEMNCMIQMIYEGRYQESVHNGTFNGMPFEGRGFMAYDNAAGKFYSTWIDNMSTGIMCTSGTMDPKGQRLEMKGEVVDPITKKVSKIKEVVYFNADNEQIHETYTTPAGGTEYKSMEIRMVR
jgi:hypothetical protein